MTRILTVSSTVLSMIPGADEARSLVLDEGTVPERLDRVLARVFDDLSRARLQGLVREGLVRCDGIVVRDPARKVGAGCRINLSVPAPLPAEPLGEALPLAVVHEDEDLIVIDKPAGLVVHPAAGHEDGTLVNRLIAHCGVSLSGIGGVRRPGIVHRLDKDTTGVMVVAKNDAAHRHLADQFADHGRTGPLERAYLAVVWGRPRQLHGTIDAPLGRGADRTKRAVKREQSEDAREAITHFEVIERFHERPDATSLASLVECRLETGRTHQIRVHMAHIGHPLIGDADYGAAFKTKANLLPDSARAVVALFDRQALHAFLLQFEHPRTGEVMHFEAPMPEDMQRLIDALKD